MTTRAVVTIQRDTALPGDETTNTFHLGQPGDNKYSAPDQVQLQTFFQDFYGAVAPGGTIAIRSILSPVLTTVGMTLTLYDLDDPSVPGAPRVPYAILPLTVAQTSGTALPEEAAVCITLVHKPVSGENPRNRRGRLFIGPLNTTPVLLADGRTRVHPTTRTALGASMKRLAEEVGGMAGINSAIVIYSPTTLQAHALEEGWVDDAFDTIRSRGPAATARTPYTVV